MMKATALEALRRFWWIAFLFALGGGILAALPEPATTQDATITYSATHTLLISSSNGSIYSDPVALNQLSLYATIGVVPERVGEALGIDPGTAASAISPSLNSTDGSLGITATATTKERAEELANTFATTLTSYMAELQENQRTDRLAALNARADRLEQDISDLEREAQANPDDRVVQAKLDALASEYSVVFEQQFGTSFDIEPTLILSTLAEAKGYPNASDTGLGAPKTRPTRAIFGLGVGAIVGAGVALLVSRLDRRIRSRAQAELLFGAPASVVIPDVGGAGTSLVVRPDRHDQLSDSYRTLRSVLTFAEAAHAEAEAPRERAAVVLVVSPGSGDGKTSIAANLAAALVEANRRTIAVNTDFRRPTLAGRLLDDDPVPLPFAFAQLSEVTPTQLLRRTPTPNLVLLDLSGMDAPPGSLARATSQALAPLARVADMIVVDSSPVGATAEVLELLPYADHVVVAIRLDHTLTGATQRSMQLLRSLTTGAMHLVVVGENIERSPYYEYGSPKGKKAKPGRRR